MKIVAPLVHALLLLVASSMTPTARAEDVTSKIEKYMEACVKVEHFNGSVLVGKNGEIVFERGYGLANAEHQVANTPQTKFRLGSITKQFTSMAIMILMEQGKLKLDDPIGKFIDDPPKAWEGVTLHHLISHTSGVHSYTAEPDYMKKMAHPETVKSMIARFKEKPLDFKPGEKFAYSNSGYFLLGAVIEKVSGMSYEAFLKKEIFDPLGMKDTGYDHFETMLPLRASGYTRGPDGLRNAQYLDMMQPYSAGSLYSTVEDLFKWDQALLAGRLVKKESMEKLFTPVKGNYAYGWSVRDQKGRKEVGHGGGINGFATQIVRFPSEKVCVVVLCNVLPSNPGKVAQDLSSIVFGESYKIPEAPKVAKVDPKLYDAYAGRYRIGPETYLTVSREGDHLMVEPTGQPKLAVLPESETDFFLLLVNAKFRFVKDNQGKVTHVVLRQGGREVKAMRVDTGDGKAEGSKAVKAPEDQKADK
jgi:CubicO group peptidase (beta-lactamase class C family)